MSRRVTWVCHGFPPRVVRVTVVEDVMLRTIRFRGDHMDTVMVILAYNRHNVPRRAVVSLRRPRLTEHTHLTSKCYVPFETATYCRPLSVGNASASTIACRRL